MGIDDLVCKVKDRLSSEKAEEITDSVLDTAAGAVNTATGGKFEDKVTGARDQVDGKIGSE